MVWMLWQITSFDRNRKLQDANVLVDNIIHKSNVADRASVNERHDSWRHVWTLPDFSVAVLTKIGDRPQWNPTTGFRGPSTDRLANRIVLRIVNAHHDCWKRTRVTGRTCADNCYWTVTQRTSSERWWTDSYRKSRSFVARRKTHFIVRYLAVGSDLAGECATAERNDDNAAQCRHRFFSK